MAQIYSPEIHNYFPGDHVYRLLRADENPNEDLFPKDPFAFYSLAKHVELGSYQDTQYISTSVSLDEIKKMAKTVREKENGRYVTVVKINMNYLKKHYPHIRNRTFDLSREEIRDKYLKNDKQYNFATSMEEVVFRDIIPKEAVEVIPVYV